MGVAVTLVPKSFGSQNLTKKLARRVTAIALAYLS